MVGHLITRLHLLYTAVKFVNQMDKLFPSRSLHPVKWEWPKRQLEHAVKRLAPTTMDAQNTKQWLVCVRECVCVWGRGWSLESETVSHSVMSDSLLPHGLQPTRLFCSCGHSPTARCPGLWSQVGLGSVTTNKASVVDKSPAELFQILCHDLHFLNVEL